MQRICLQEENRKKKLVEIDDNTVPVEQFW